MGGVVDGSAVNAATTNAAFLEKNADDTTLFKLGLNDSDVSTVSGTAVTNVQRDHNALWSFLGGLINQAKTYVPTWANNSQGAQTFGNSNDSIFAKIAAIIAAFDPASGSQAVRSGAAAIGNGASSLAVTFAVSLPNANYAVEATFENTTDATPIFLQGIITAKSAAGFTLTFNAATDTANYKLNYVVRNFA